MRRYLVELAAITALAAVPAIAAADPRVMTDAARRELDRGLALFRTREYARAIAAFDAGFAIDPHPDFLYAKGQAQRLEGDCAGAITSYRTFLATSPPETEARLTRFNLERCEADLAAAARAIRPAPPWYTDRLGGVLAGGAVAASIAGAALFVIADGHVDRARESETLDEYEAEIDVVSNRRMWAKISIGVAGALAISSVIRYWTRPEYVRVTPAVGRDGAAVWLEGRF